MGRNMNHYLPYTPAEALDLDVDFRRKMNRRLFLAKLLRRWNYPYKDGATDFQEMTLEDVYYWVHKAQHPITRPEKGETLQNLMNTNSQSVKLPPGFEKQHSLTFGAAGDILYPQGVQYDDKLYENIADLLFGQTVSFANLESPVTTQPLVKEVISNKAAPLECCSREQFSILKGYKGKNFSILNTANNHMFDWGVEGIETTLQAFKEEGILDLGTNHSPEEAGKGKKLTKEGITLGFASATFGLNGHPVPASESYRINVSKLLSKYAPPDLELLKRQIDDCKQQGCDFIIASLHWGFEFELFPRRKQVEAAHALVEYGADAVICCHPHVIQPVEYYRSQRDPNRVAVIAHSLGSLSWGYSAPYLVLSLLLNMKLTKGEFKGKAVTYIETADVTPVFRSVVDKSGQQTRIEKLVDHIDGSTRHSREYIAEIGRYADLVLGESHFAGTKGLKSADALIKAVA